MPERVVWSGVLRIATFDVRAYILDDGTRVLDVEDVEALLAAPGDVSVEDMSGLARWIRGEQ